MTEQPLKKVWKKGGSILAGIDGFLHGTGPTAAPVASTAASLRGIEDEPQLSIREFMTPFPVTTRIDQPLHRALEVLIERNLSALPVLDENGAVVGLLNERHVLLAVGDPDGATITGVMDHEPHIVDADDPIVEVVDRLMAINVRQVIVLEASTLVGVVTRADLMPAVQKMLRKRTRRAHRISTVMH